MAHLRTQRRPCGPKPITPRAACLQPRIIIHGCKNKTVRTKENENVCLTLDLLLLHLLIHHRVSSPIPIPKRVQLDHQSFSASNTRSHTPTHLATDKCTVLFLHAMIFQSVQLPCHHRLPPRTRESGHLRIFVDPHATASADGWNMFHVHLPRPGAHGAGIPTSVHIDNSGGMSLCVSASTARICRCSSTISACALSSSWCHA